MNILEINKFYYLRRGAERHLLDVTDLFRSHGHTVGVFTMRHPKGLEHPLKKYEVSFVGYNQDDSNLWQRIKGTARMFWSFEARRNMEKLLQEFHPDIVHVHNAYHQLSSSILGPLKKHGIPIVMTVHDYHIISPDKDVYYPEVGEQFWKFLFVKKYGFVKRLLLVLKMYWERWTRAYALVDVFIAPSQFVKDTLVSAGMDAGKIVVIPHFIAGEKSMASEKVSGEKYALCAGSISEGKGVAELINIFDALQFPLVLAGKREEGYELPKSEWVREVGQKSREELNVLIQNASCVVSGSTLPETFGLVALEAISFGKPFFGLKTGAYAEIILNGRNGYLADNYAELERLLRDFLEGKISFDNHVIQQDAYDRFGADRYHAEMMKIFESLTHAE